MLRTGMRAPILVVLLGALVLGGLLFRSQVVSARGNVGAPVKAGATNHTVSVAGHGEVDVQPDTASITLGVQTRGVDAAAAVANNAAKMTDVINAVKAQGVTDSHIQTSNLSIWYDSERQTYVVDHQVTVRLDSISKTGAVLDAAVGAGANSSWGVSFGLKDQSTAHAQAIQSAVADARKRADAMATALGVSITGVGSASEGSYSPPIYYGTDVKAAAPAPGVSTPIQTGDMTVSADVSVVYTFG